MFRVVTITLGADAGKFAEVDVLVVHQKPLGFDMSTGINTMKTLSGISLIHLGAESGFCIVICI